MPRRKIEKYIIEKTPIEKELKNTKTITYKIRFIDSIRFMSSFSSNLVGNLSKGLRNN